VQWQFRGKNCPPQSVLIRGSNLWNFFVKLVTIHSQSPVPFEPCLWHYFALRNYLRFASGGQSILRFPMPGIFAFLSRSLQNVRMHLQINLSNQLAKQWKATLSDVTAETHPLLQWRIDKIRLANTTANYICVNEATLFSFLLPRLPGKKQLQIQQYFVDRLQALLDFYLFPREAFGLFDNCPVLFGKTSSRRLIATVTDMRLRYEDHYYLGTPLLEAEERVNQTPTQGPNYRYPLDEFLKLRDLFDDSEGSMITFQMPVDLVYAARQSFSFSDPVALRCFDTTSETDGMFTARLTLMDLSVAREAINPPEIPGLGNRSPNH